MNEDREFMKIEESGMRFEIGMSRDIEELMRVGVCMVIFRFKMDTGGDTEGSD
jgi:hypothetical protein